MFLNGLGVKIFEKLNCTGCHENKYVVNTILIHITEQIDIAQVIAPHIIDTRIHTIRHKIVQGTMIQKSFFPESGSYQISSTRVES